MTRWIWIIWGLASIGWVGFVSYLCSILWPHLSLDLSHTDPATLAVYERAVVTHIVQYCALGVSVPIAALVVWRFLSRQKR